MEVSSVEHLDVAWIIQVLAWLNKEIRELLRTTALDTLWALYDSAAEAIEALGGVD